MEYSDFLAGEELERAKERSRKLHEKLMAGEFDDDPMARRIRLRQQTSERIMRLEKEMDEEEDDF